MSPKQTKIMICYLLIEATEERDQMLQWACLKKYQLAAKFEARFEKVLELMEVLDCGSVGGFGKGQPSTSCLLNRLVWLKTKYKSD